MHIVMVTNTFTPMVGGVAQSVSRFTESLRAIGHRVLVVAPEFENMPKHEKDVIRVPAIQNFNGSDFSVRLPIPIFLDDEMQRFQPHVIHSHHPFLMGDTAQRLARKWHIPLLFTHHTMYEQYTHYVPVDSPLIKRFTIELATGYANLCDQVIAPSESVAKILRQRGVKAPITCIPTGVDVEQFRYGNGASFRTQNGIPNDAFVVGHLGRLAPEKNLAFLAKAAARFMRANPKAHFLVVGSGPSMQNIQAIFTEQGINDRLHTPGKMSGKHLIDAYHAMDVFAFSSYSETQGMVLVEAMAAGVPVVALDASGAREVVIDRENGRLLPKQDEQAFADALDWVDSLNPDQSAALHQKAHERAQTFSMTRCTQRLAAIYEALYQGQQSKHVADEGIWQRALEQLNTEWNLWSNFANAMSTALRKSPQSRQSPPPRNPSSENPSDTE